MQPYLDPSPAGFGSVDVVAKTLVDSKSPLLEVRHFEPKGDAESGWFVRRTTELARPDSLASSVYVKGFPCKTEDGTTPEEKKAIKDEEEVLQKELEQWTRALMSSRFKSLRMRRADKLPEAGSTMQPAKGRGVFKVCFNFDLSTQTYLTWALGIRLH